VIRFLIPFVWLLVALAAAGQSYTIDGKPVAGVPGTGGEPGGGGEVEPDPPLVVSCEITEHINCDGVCFREITTTFADGTKESAYDDYRGGAFVPDAEWPNCPPCEPPEGARPWQLSSQLKPYCNDGETVWTSWFNAGVFIELYGVFDEDGTPMETTVAGMTAGFCEDLSWTNYLATIADCSKTLKDQMAANNELLANIESALEGPLEISGTVSIDGPVSITGPVEVEGKVEVCLAEDGDPLEVTGTVSVEGPVTVEGKVEVCLAEDGDPLEVTGTVSVEGPVTVEGKVEVCLAEDGDPLEVTGTVSVEGPVTVEGKVEVCLPEDGDPLEVSMEPKWEAYGCDFCYETEAATEKRLCNTLGLDASSSTGQAGPGRWGINVGGTFTDFPTPAWDGWDEAERAAWIIALLGNGFEYVPGSGICGEQAVVYSVIQGRSLAARPFASTEVIVPGGIGQACWEVLCLPSGERTFRLVSVPEGEVLPDDTSLVPCAPAESDAEPAADPCENKSEVEHVSQGAVVTGSGSIPAGLKSLTICRISGSITVPSAGGFILNNAIRCHSWNATESDCVTGVLPAFAVAGTGRWQWTGLQPVE